MLKITSSMIYERVECYLLEAASII